MENKTCGECRYYHPVWEHEGVCTIDETLDKACDWEKCNAWQKKEPLSHGDRIRQMSNEELCVLICNNLRAAIRKPEAVGVDYEQKLLDWLNAPKKAR